MLRLGQQLPLNARRHIHCSADTVRRRTLRAIPIIPYSGCRYKAFPRLERRFFTTGSALSRLFLHNWQHRKPSASQPISQLGGQPFSRRYGSNPRRAGTHRSGSDTSDSHPRRYLFPRSQHRLPRRKHLFRFRGRWNSGKGWPAAFFSGYIRLQCLKQAVQILFCIKRRENKHHIPVIRHFRLTAEPAEMLCCLPAVYAIQCQPDRVLKLGGYFRKCRRQSDDSRLAFQFLYSMY